MYVLRLYLVFSQSTASILYRYADCIFLYPFHERVSGGSGGLLAGSSVATEERTTLAAKSVQRYLDRTPTDKVRERREVGIRMTRRDGNNSRNNNSSILCSSRKVSDCLMIAER